MAELAEPAELADPILGPAAHSMDTQWFAKGHPRGFDYEEVGDLAIRSSPRLRERFGRDAALAYAALICATVERVTRPTLRSKPLCERSAATATRYNPPS